MTSGEEELDNFHAERIFQGNESVHKKNWNFPDLVGG